MYPLRPTAINLKRRLESLARPMALVQPLEKGGQEKQQVRCVACAHRCLIYPGRAGVCKVRFNQDGVLYGPWGYVAGLQNDPIEKKPFYHVLPGSRAFSFGMLGCDFHCPFCQNWVTTQTLRDPAALSNVMTVRPSRIIELAQDAGALSITSTYNEPLITTEWAVDIFKEAKSQGFYTSFVSNGNNTAEGVAYLKPWLDHCNVDLKCFTEKGYRTLGGTLKGVQQGIQRLYDAGIWVEVVTLLVPGFNDSPEEVAAMAGFIKEVSPSIPWHVTAFHPDYKMKGTPYTPAATLARARQTGLDAGLWFVYTGNLPGGVENGENTFCPDCGELLVERWAMSTVSYRLRDGRCPRCQAAVPGVWHTPRTLESVSGHLRG